MDLKVTIYPEHRTILLKSQQGASDKKCNYGSFKIISHSHCL